jgi:L-fuconolactonase
MTEIIDAHHHFLDPARVDYPFLRFLPELARFTGPEEFRPALDSAGVARSVVVQAADCEEETQFLLEQAGRADWVAAVVGWLPLTDPAAVGAALERHRAESPRLCGVRHLIHDEPDEDWLVQASVLESLGLLAEAGLSFDLSAFTPRHIDHVRTLAERVPDLRVVICHFGVPRLSENEWEPWASSFAAAATHPGCHVKVSGLDMTIGGCDAERFRPYFDHALAHFGPERMIWASNWPVSLRGKGYRELLDTARGLLGGCSEAEQSAIFGANAARFYRLGALGTSR